ncbi:amidase family protein [Alteromonas sp. CI.11.F.A3]|uniref:amidase n=1 Tax=Alteromonas sp. CI.11.F.A3 TaxID=3079555 RepID=UPI00294307E4|nr:amidase family protein [Alteromonas sp. CI.11.F.A3]WOI37785.1 amidase family protein [Alteromonas sp. CI.11.F.A3]
MKKSLFLLVLFLSGCGSDDDNSKEAGGASSFDIVGASISDIHNAILNSETTCEIIIQEQLDRIESLDRQGPELNSLIQVNENALSEAIALDDKFEETGELDAMHCVAVTLKDNVNTKDMPTTGGALAFNQPDDDAYITRKIREADGIIIGKANLHEYAFGYTGGSLLGGIPRNAYDLSKGPGGSSSGTGTSVASSLAVVGIGTDTGGSIRVPSSVQGLIGLRPSMRLVSQDGIMPLAPFQDTAGPMCKKVADCAVFLNVITGYDSSTYSGQREEFAIDSPLMTNELQYQVETGVKDYSENLDANAFQGARVGVIRELFGDGDSVENLEVQRIMNAAIENMKLLGASVEDVTVPELEDTLNNFVSLSRYEFSYSLTDYLSSWSSVSDLHYRSFDEVYSSGEYLERSEGSFSFYALLGEDRWNDETYLKNVYERPTIVRERFTRAFDNTDVFGDRIGLGYDILIYPSITGLAGSYGSSPTSSGSANRISPFTGFPALTMPVGYSSIESELPLPVGMEMLGREFSEAELLSFAYAYEQAYQPRIEPTLTSDMLPPSLVEEGTAKSLTIENVYEGSNFN